MFTLEMRLRYDCNIISMLLLCNSLASCSTACGLVKADAFKTYSDGINSWQTFDIGRHGLTFTDCRTLCLVVNGRRTVGVGRWPITVDIVPGISTALLVCCGCTIARLARRARVACPPRDPRYQNKPFSRSMSTSVDFGRPVRRRCWNSACLW